MPGYLSKPPPGVQANNNHPLHQGLQGCWIFNEGNGLRANDGCGNGFDGVLTGFEPFSPTSGWVGGKNGQSLIFNGTTNFVKVPGNTKYNAQTISVEALINTNTVAAGTRRIAVQARDATGASDAWALFMVTSSISWGIKNTTDAGIVTTASKAITANNWFHCVGTYDGANIFLYINGVLAASTPKTGTVDYVGNNPILIGETANVQFWNGFIDFVRIYNRTLNAYEVQKLYSNNFDMFGF